MLTPPRLEGSLVQLEPLALDHTDGLAECAQFDTSTFGYTWVPRTLDETRHFVEVALKRQASGTELVFAIRRRADGRIVGSTRFLDLVVFSWSPAWPPTVAPSAVPDDAHFPSVCEIGGTWLARSAQRTGVNVESKLLMLTHAFDRWSCLRVTFKTDARN